MTVLQGDRSHGEDWVKHSVSAAPPSPGGVDVSADDLTAIGGGGAAGGLSYNELPSLWQLLTDTAEDAAIRTPLTLLLDQMEDSPAFRRGQVAGALGALQEAHEQVSLQADGDDRLSLPVGTVFILAHVLLRHMP